MQSISSPHVVVIGSGTSGETLATTLKATYPHFKVTVIDKRSETTRTHGLSIAKAPVDTVCKLLEKALSNSNQTNAEHVKSLKDIFENWIHKVISTNDIEKTLMAQAKLMGCDVRRDSAYELAKSDIKTLLDPTYSSDLHPDKQQLRALLQSADLIVAADGAHSVVREDLNIPLVEKNIHKYAIELKYKTPARTSKQGMWELSTLSSQTGHLSIEVMGNQQKQGYKQVTHLMLVNKDAYDILRKSEDEGKVKDYSNPWTFDQLHDQSLGYPRMENIYKCLDCYRQKLKNRDGGCIDEKIVALKLETYCAEKSFSYIHGKPVVIIGDANSGLILQEGFNKAIHEVALCVQAIAEYFQKDGSPDSLEKYSDATQKLFKEKLGKITSRIGKLEVLEVPLQLTASSLQASEELSDISSSSSSGCIIS